MGASLEQLQSQSPQEIILTLGAGAREASYTLAQFNEDQINGVLNALANALIAQTEDILKANEIDIKAAQNNGLSDAMIDRLRLTPERIEGIAKGARDVAALPDPVGRTLWENERPNGLQISRISVPIGVLGMIYESRPNVTIDAACLCLKSRNSVILRGGSESLNSSLKLHQILQTCLEDAGFPIAAVSMVPISDREAVGAMLECDKYIDVIIPRGGKGLTGRVQQQARMPVFSHLDGICHVYVDGAADLQMAKDIVYNAKLRRTGICGAAETILFDKALSDDFVRDILSVLLDEDCEVRGDAAIQKLDDRITAASDEDWVTEYLASIISAAYVDGVQGAVDHINAYSSHHTDSIVTQDAKAAEIFLNRVDSGSVMHNASTQFADGGEYGLGAEIGIATGKMHARGPVGLEQLCTYKYIVKGNGQTRP